MSVLSLESSPPAPDESPAAGGGERADEMKLIYVSARYGRKNDAAGLAEKIIANTDCQIVARWLYEGPQTTNLDDPAAKPAEWAIMDFDDVRRCDALVLISDPENTVMTGGKHVEVGYALALGKPVIVLGRRENVFHYHPSVTLAQNLESLFDALEKKVEAA